MEASRVEGCGDFFDDADLRRGGRNRRNPPRPANTLNFDRSASGGGADLILFFPFW
jgi:hypothetical protein